MDACAYIYALCAHVWSILKKKIVGDKFYLVKNMYNISKYATFRKLW